MQCIEDGKNPFTTEMVVKSLEVSEQRLSMNVDGTQATESTDEDSELNPHTPSKRRKVTIPAAEAEETGVESAQKPTQQCSGNPEDLFQSSCIIQAPQLNEISS